MAKMPMEPVMVVGAAHISSAERMQVDVVGEARQIVYGTGC